MVDYKSKYIKYKNKYLKLKGGADINYNILNDNMDNDVRNNDFLPEGDIYNIEDLKKYIESLIKQEGDIQQYIKYIKQIIKKAEAGEEVGISNEQIQNFKEYIKQLGDEEDEEEAEALAREVRAARAPQHTWV